MTDDELLKLINDAVRYRYLRRTAYVGIARYPKPHETWCWNLPNPTNGNDLDTTIDAAMAAGE